MCKISRKDSIDVIYKGNSIILLDQWTENLSQDFDWFKSPKNWRASSRFSRIVFWTFLLFSFFLPNADNVLFSVQKNRKYTRRKVNMVAKTLVGGGGMTKVIKSYEGGSLQ